MHDESQAQAGNSAAFVRVNVNANVRANTRARHSWQRDICSDLLETLYDIRSSKTHSECRYGRAKSTSLRIRSCRTPGRSESGLATLLT